MSLQDTRFGFIGGGAMAQALAGGLVGAGAAPNQLLAADPDPARQKVLNEALEIRVTADNAEVVAESDVVVIAVKPNMVSSVLAALSDTQQLERPLWVSIAAGIPLAKLETGLGAGARVVRAMPNTPALVHTGATAYCVNAQVSKQDRRLAQTLFEAVGTVWEAPHENLLDAVTGLSGSGPAYVFVFLEALADAGVRVGLPRDAAAQLAVQTVYGAAKLARDTGRHPASLKDQVTSPGGTTIAGLERLEARGIRAALYEAVEAATERSRELADA